MKKPLLKKSALAALVLSSGICFAQTPSLLMDMSPSTGSCLYARHIEYQGKVFFTANANSKILWKTDGTTAGTEQIAPFAYGFFSDSLVKMNNKLYFSAAAGFGSNDLYESGGTPATTTMVKSFQNFYPTIKVMNGNIFFIATSSNMEGLWKSNGTLAGTVKLCTINGSSSTERPMIEFNNEIYFAAYDGLFKTNGTTVDTVMNNINPGYYIENFQIYNNELFFSTRDELWKTNGTTTGTVLVKTFANSNYAISKFLVCNGILYFDFNLQTYKSDGTDAGTSMFIAYQVKDRMVVNNTLYYVLPYGSYGDRLYKTDGTLKEAVITSNITYSNYNNTPGSVSSLANINNTLYFSAHDTSGYELWTSGGTEATTFKLTTIPGTTNGWLEQITSISADTFMFYMSTPAYGSELWVTIAGSTTSLNEHNRGNSDITISPNPSNGKFIINSQNLKGKISVYNLLGEEIYKSNTSSLQLAIDISNQPKGIYFVKVFDGTNSYTKKIIIQ